MPTTSELACSTAAKTLARPSRMVIVCVMSVPHISLTLSVMIVPAWGLVLVRPTRCGASRPFSRITRRTRRGLVRTPAHRLDFLWAKGHLGFQPGDLVVAVIAFAFFQGCSRACERTFAPLGQPGD